MKEEIVILVISVIFIAFGVHLLLKGNHLLTNGKKAKAIIFKNHYIYSGTDTGLYYPVVRFLTDKQEWITQELSIGYNPEKDVGAKLEIIYDTDDLTNVEINSTFQLKIIPGIFLAIGLCGIIFDVLELLGITQIIK